MPAFPRFIGGPTLGSNLGNVTTAKAAIVGQLLAIIFPGILMYLIQGSPSGSSASGGTHVDEIGDAGDWVYRYADGRAAGLVVYLMASILWRMLDCLSYVRGFDVNKDGVIDDSFSQHNHIIDREGGPKAQAVRNQIALYLAHLDGLVGGRADRESVVPQTMTLAEYQTPAGQATFLFRFKALTSEALSLPAHIEPVTDQEDDMHYFTVNSTGYAASATELVRIDDINVGTAIVKARTGADLTPAELDMFKGVQARLSPPAIAIVVDQAGTEYAIGPKGPIVLNQDQAASIVALRNGATVTSSQTTAAAQALGQGVQPTTTTVTATIDPAVLSAAVNDALNKALGSIAWTTRKA